MSGSADRRAATDAWEARGVALRDAWRPPGDLAGPQVDPASMSTTEQQQAADAAWTARRSRAGRRLASPRARGPPAPARSPRIAPEPERPLTLDEAREAAERAWQERDERLLDAWRTAR